LTSNTNINIILHADEFKIVAHLLTPLEINIKLKSL